MNPSKLADDILKKIKEEHIEPRSKYYFYAKNILFWGLFAAAIILGAISFAIVLYASFNTDFAIGQFVETEELLEQWLTLLPLLWMLFIGIAVGVGIVGLKHTKRGYRIALLTLVGSNVLASVVLGTGLYAAGGAEVIEETLEEKVSFYEGMREKHQKFWGNPSEKGRLSGRVISVDEENQLMTLEGPYGKSWEVPFGENTPMKTAPEVGQIMKMKGQAKDDKHFEPEQFERALIQEHIQKRIEDRFRERPELRAQVESRLSPETRAQLEAAKNAGERPSPELRTKIKNEIESQTTNGERGKVRDRMLENRPPILDGERQMMRRPIRQPNTP